MNTNFLLENDPRLARAIWECWQKLEDKNLERAVRTVDRLIALERRTPNAAMTHLHHLVQWLADTEFSKHPRKEEIEQELQSLKTKTPTVVKQSAEAVRKVVNTAEGSGRTEAIDTLLQTADAIRAGDHSGSWQEMETQQASQFIEQVNPINDKYQVSLETAIIHSTQLTWYDDVTLIRIVDKSWDNSKLVTYFLTLNGDIYYLNGTSPPIHEVNAKAPAKITDDNVIDYLRFFCFFVRGEEGPFFLAENMDDPMLPQGTDEKFRSALESCVKPVSFKGLNEHGHRLCDAIVYYSNALFGANFAVQPGGMVEMLDDKPIAADLPVMIDQPLS